MKYTLATIALQNLDVDGINVTLLEINENSVHPVVFVMIWDSLLVSMTYEAHANRYQQG